MTGSFAALVVSALLFTGGHFALSSAPLRRSLIARLGRLPYLVLYSVIAVATLVWLIVAYARAPYAELWGEPLWARTLALIVMPFAAILLVCGALTASPTAVGGARVLGRDDPAPGAWRSAWRSISSYCSATNGPSVRARGRRGASLDISPE